MTTDDPGRAKSMIFNDQKRAKDVFYVGTIASAVNGNMSKGLSQGTDLALLSMCDHVIISHGTFGMWAAFLASSENTHIMADIKSEEEIEEIRAVKNANFSNIIFMDDQ